MFNTDNRFMRVSQVEHSRMNEVMGGWLTDEELGFNFNFTPPAEFKMVPKGLVMGSTFLNDISTWRENVKNHVIFNDTFISHKGETDDLYYEMIFKIVDRLKGLIKDDYVPLMGISFGKDSSTVLVLTMLAYGELKLEGFTPKHFGLVLHTDTRIENPELSNLAKDQWNTLMETIAELDLPVAMRLAQPLFASSFLGAVVSGRTLPTTTSSKNRNCSADYKVRPGQQVMRQYFKQITKKDPNAKPLLLLGVRDAEGTLRASNIEKFGGQEDPLAVTFVEDTKQFVCYPIKDFTTDNVWEILTCSGMGKVIPSILSFDRTVKVYADSSGECVFLSSAAESEQTNTACGVRHGCVLCCASGEKDKSMEELLKMEEYAYLRQLSRVRNFVVKTHWDWNGRNPFGKSINEYGYTTIKPEAYSFEKCKKILHALITADALEQKRANSVMEAIENGELPPIYKHFQAAVPRFQIVTEEDIVKLEFAWSTHPGSSRSYEALNIWHKVYERAEYELLEWIDDFQAVPRTSPPKELYIYVGQNWEEDGLNAGLRDHIHEMTLSDPDIAITAHSKQNKDGSEDDVYFTLPFNEAASMSVDEDILRGYTRSDVMWKGSRSREELPLAGELSLLRTGTISPARGMRNTYHQTALRSQWWRGQGLYGDLTYGDILNQKEIVGSEVQTKVLTRKEYQAAISGIDVSSLVEPENISEVDEALLLDEYSYLQTDMFGEPDVKVTVRFAKPKSPNKKKRRTPADAGQSSLF